MLRVRSAAAILALMVDITNQKSRTSGKRPDLRAEVVEILGVPITLTNYRQVLDWIDDAIAVGHRGYICVAPVHLVMLVQDDAALAAAVDGADFVVPDGQPLVWSASALGGKGASRVYGPDLMIESCRRASETGAPIYLFGGTGGLLITLSTVSMIYLFIRRVFFSISVLGSPVFQVSAMLFILGFQSMLMGLIAELLVRTYHESQRKPTYTIRTMLNLDQDPRE